MRTARSQSFTVSVVSARRRIRARIEGRIRSKSKPTSAQMLRSRSKELAGAMVPPRSCTIETTPLASRCKARLSIRIEGDMDTTTPRPTLDSPLRLPCGATLSNRIAKAAMTEGLADAMNRATRRHVRLYETWSRSGAGLLLTGNVMVDRRYLERPNNVAIDDNGGIDALRAYARAGTSEGNHLWMQIGHAGRQTPAYVNPEPVAP